MTDYSMGMIAAMIAPASEVDGDSAQLFNRSTDGGGELTLTRRLRKDLDRGILRRPLFDRYVAAVQRALAVQPPRRPPERVLARARAARQGAGQATAVSRRTTTAA